MRGPLVALLLLAATSPIAGCKEYAEAVTCRAPQVLDDNDRCYTPDAGISTCADLCAQVPSWNAAQLSCLRMAIASSGLGTVPPACAMTSFTAASCMQCVMAAGGTDATCMSVGTQCIAAGSEAGLPLPMDGGP